ncbi:MAG: hypothetical protein WC632_04170 [Candidatus Margulisiibacteriota bacterium]
MKKAISVFMFLLLCVSLSQAQMLIGGRAAGMGGAGVASTDDISAAYYNPAALMRSEVLLTDIKVDLGASYSDLTSLSNALTNASSPAKFMLDNYASNLNFNGNLSGLVGINLRKIGLSVIPIFSAQVAKPANSFNGYVIAGGHYDGVLTLGSTFSVPYLPAALDVGVNLKSLNGVAGQITAVAGTPPTTGSGNQDYGTGSGTGFDLGVLTSFDVPFVSKVAVGATMRNLSSSYTLKMTRQVATMDATAGTTTLGPVQNLPDQIVNLDSSTAIGAYATIPVVGVGVAADIEITKTDTNTHLGLEYPLLFGVIVLRAGLASGPNLSLTTVGAEVNLKILRLGLVTIADAKNTGLTNTVADITFGL